MTTVCSPHLRGWSPFVGNLDGLVRLLPAPAGMVPTASTSPATGRPCSPPPRGRSLSQRSEHDRGILLPAPAGMVPSAPTTAGSWSTAPRTRGDGPAARSSARCDGSCSPHPRGWPLDPIRGSRPGRLLPAPAGMAPMRGTTAAARSSAPRTRGDGPGPGRGASWNPDCSPHPRGWPPAAADGLPGLLLLPAPAGMAPAKPRRPTSSRTAPRTRGDGPSPVRVARSTVACSPHPRGWPLARGGAVGARTLLPAPAGMAPFGDVMQS